MSSFHRIGASLLTAVGLLAAASFAHAGWMDHDPDLDGVQSASWPEPSTITVYLDALADPDKSNFTDGVKAWSDKLDKITVVFKDGDPPDDLTDEQKKLIVALKQSDDKPGGYYALAEVDASFDPGASHGTIVGPATITIWKGVLNQGWNTFLKNLGTHEFGHILGLADSVQHLDPIPDGYSRIGAMDPNFHKDMPYLAPTAAELELLSQHYSVVPQPGTAALLVLALTSCSRRRTVAAR